MVDHSGVDRSGPAGEHVTDPDVLDRLTGLVDLVNSGTAGLAALQRLVEVTMAATGACGAMFAEFTEAPGRIVASTGAFEQVRGRPVRIPDSSVEWLLGEPRLLEFDRTRLGPHIERSLAEQGLFGLVRVPAMTRGRRVGILGVCYPDGAPSPGPAERSALVLLASMAAHLYTLGNDLPVDDDVRPRREDDRSLFIAVTSHELRTPVTVIRGYADTLAEHWDSLGEDDRRAGLAVIRQRARDLGRLLDRLLSAAGDDVRSGEAVAGVPFDLLDAMTAAVAELPADLRRGLETQLPDGLPKALGDRSSVATIVTELVTNARKYSPDGTEVELTAGADVRVVWLRVADRGVGIRSEDAERAFDRFRQLGAGDQQPYGGVGLGLYLVRRLVERHRGWVSLRPRDGGGTIAEVRLPRADASFGEA